MNKSAVHNLVEHLRQVYQAPKQKQFGQTKPNYEQMKKKLRNRYRNPWKANGVVHESHKLPRLPIGDLDNWQILRINMAERSYNHTHKSMKISSVSKEFNKVNWRAKDGKIPYMYESQIEKIDRLREKMKDKQFKRSNTIQSQLFGFPSQVHKKPKQKKDRPVSLKILNKRI